MNATVPEDRILKLETSVRRHRAAIAGLVTVFVLLELVLPLTRDSVSARAFVLESGGRTRASLAATATGTPALSLFDGAGNARAVLSMREDGSPDLTLIDAAGIVRAALRVSETAVPTLFLTGAGGEVKAAMGVPADGLPALVLLGENDRVRYMTP